MDVRVEYRKQNKNTWFASNEMRGREGMETGAKIRKRELNGAKRGRNLESLPKKQEKKMGPRFNVLFAAVAPCRTGRGKAPSLWWLEGTTGLAGAVPLDDLPPFSSGTSLPLSIRVSNHSRDNPHQPIPP